MVERLLLEHLGRVALAWLAHTGLYPLVNSQIVCWVLQFDHVP
jgi:hypothetical protein